MSDFIADAANEDFNRVRFREMLERLQNFLNPEKRELLSFDHVKSLVRPGSETYRGIQVVPLELVVGSEGRYRDFNNHFLPKSNFLRSRWISVDRANLKDVILPPVSLYEIGGVYFVRDGNHRVSVAKSRGQLCIDAEVIALASEIAIKPGMTIDDLRREVLVYEKRVFYGETGFGDLTECWDMDFSSPGRYNEIYEHILVHKYFINQEATGEIPLAEAVLSWYRNVYKPVIDVIAESDIVSHFPERTKSDLYVFIVKHWDILKRRYGFAVDLREAAADFTDNFAKPSAPRRAGFLNRLLARMSAFGKGRPR
jgi:hypothetical protein